MSQATTWSVPLSGPATPTTMATRTDDSLDALLSGHSGSARPSYAVAGTVWISTATAGKLKKYLFDGTNDRLLETIDIATGAISYEPGTMTGPVNYANFAITNPAGKWLKGYISPGFNLANNATDGVNDIDFPAGQVASDEATPILMDHAAGTAQLDVVYGTGNGGRFSSAAISDGTWHCFVISNGTTVSRGFSKNADPTADSNYPSGYTHYRRVASWLRESGSLVAITQDGDIFRRAIATDRNSTAAASTLLTLSIPTGLQTIAPLLNITLQGTVSCNCTIAIGDRRAGSADTNVAQVLTGAGDSSDSVRTQPPPVFFASTLGQIYFSQVNTTGTPSTSAVQTLGWVDTRGRV